MYPHTRYVLEPRICSDEKGCKGDVAIILSCVQQHYTLKQDVVFCTVMDHMVIISVSPTSMQQLLHTKYM